MKVTILGCSGGFPSSLGPASSYLVEADGYRLVLDMGNGSMSRLLLTGSPDVDAIILSHLHVDHCGDAGSYAAFRKFHPALEFTRGLPLYGPAGVGPRIEGIFGEPGVLDGVYTYHELAADFPDPVELGPFHVDFCRTRHPVPTYATRTTHRETGRSLVFTADTGYTAALSSFVRGADVLLCEAAWTGCDPHDRHLTGGEAAQIAGEAGVGLLLLTHLVEWDTRADTIAAAQAGPVPVVVAEVGETYPVGS